MDRGIASIEAMRQLPHLFSDQKKKPQEIK